MLGKQELKLELTKDAATVLVKHGFDPQFGARPLKRTLQRELINDLAKHLLAGNYVKGDTVLMDADPEQSGGCCSAGSRWRVGRRW